MKTKFDEIDIYQINTYNKILTLAPIIAIVAAITITIARLLGLFSFVFIPYIIAFDVVCLSYFVIAEIFKRRGIIVDGIVSQKRLNGICLLLDAIVVLQWNMITYIFPTQDFWGFAPMFILLTAFLFNSKAVLYEIIGLSLSIALSWIVVSDKLLPIRNDQFVENLTFRIIALVISFFVIYILTVLAESFMFKIKENFKQLEEKNKQLEQSSKDIIDFTADIIEERDSTSGSHVKRLKEYTRILATSVKDNYPEYELDNETIELITLASVLHDVGKIGIPDSILNKPGKLTPEEFEVIKKHTIIGAHTIEKLPDSVGGKYKKLCREICLYHHEKYDGKGYPVGLIGDEIPISAQIVSIVDCFDALSTDRPYKAAFPKEKAINMILGGECGVFSEKMRDCLVKCKDKLLS